MSDVIIWYAFEEKNIPFGGLDLSSRLEIVYTELHHGVGGVTIWVGTYMEDRGTFCYFF